MSEYTIEYGSALLMNLSLRAAGKRAFEDPEVDALGMLSDLMESVNPSVRTYCNGTLYSILQRPKVREAARVAQLRADAAPAAERRGARRAAAAALLALATPGGRSTSE